MEMCSCLQCLSGGRNSTVTSDTDRLHQSMMAGYSRFHSSSWPLRTGRHMKGLCFLLGSLTFCIGVAIGLLVSLYLLPLTSVDPGFDHRTYESPNPQHLVGNQFLEDRIPLTTTPSESVSTTPESIPDRISSRFPEFAQLEALKKGESSGEYKQDFQNPIPRRPNPNVQFIPAAANRILSLVPIHDKIPSPKFSRSSPVEGFLEKGSESEVVSPVGGEGQRLGTDNFDLLDSIYWSPQVERQLPQGFTESQLESWRNFVHNSTIIKMEEGCGRMQNRLLTLSNETRACCRYRQNSDQIQGEIFSFYLSQLLGIRNVAPSALKLIQVTTDQWAPIREDLQNAQWTDEKPVVFTQFLENLSPANIPLPFRDSKRSLHPADVLNSVSNLDVSELAQWSDLIVFDYLTANLDRIVNNLFNFQWNPSMMDAPAHNLVRDSATGLLVFLDNESGLLHGYRLLDKYEQYHRLMLDSLCIFRRPTAAAIKKLYREKNVGMRLKRMFQRLELQLVDYLPMLPERSIKILNRRIEVVHNQIVKCESLYVP